MTQTQPTTPARDRAAEAAFLKIGKGIVDRAREIAAERRKGMGR